MNVNKDSLPAAYIQTIVQEVHNPVATVIDVGMNALIQEEIFSQVPFISTALALFKIGNTIYDYHFQKKIFIFLERIRDRLADEEEKAKHIKKFKEKGQIEKNKELEAVLIVIAHYINEDKPKWLADLYIAYIGGIIDWQRFSAYSEIISQFLPGDKEVLLQGDKYDVSDLDVSDSLLRLVSMGLIRSVAKSVSVGNTVGEIVMPAMDKKDYVLTEFGKTLREILNED